MAAKKNRNFVGEIKVSSRIIDDLSSGLYHTPAACLKELINNSYDARATVVNVFVKPDADRIIIEDDGDGISREEFVRHFDRVSESYKRDESGITAGKPPRGGRKKIGKIGIGFIAANELCEILEIYSTKAGSSELLHVRIDFKEMTKPLAERKRGKRGEDLVKADYKGEIQTAEKAEHYTQLHLTGVDKRSPHLKEIMAGAGPRSEDDHRETISLYGLKADSVAKVLRNKAIVDWKRFDFYSETMLNVALNVPVRYHDGWMPKAAKPVTEPLETALARIGFTVNYDGTDLRKPIVFDPPEDQFIVEPFELAGNYVGASGYFYAQHGTIRPNNLQGLLVRIRQAAVGEYDSSFWGFPTADSPVIQKWISSEIWADDRLEDAMNIDRRTLREAHPSYVELRNAVHKALRSFLNRVTNQLYRTPSRHRRERKASEFRKSVKAFAREVLASDSPMAAKEVARIVTLSAAHPKVQRALERQYSVVEVLEIVRSVSQEFMNAKEMAVFLDRLAKRLLDD